MVGHGKRVLEVGCATGYMSDHLSRRGNRVTGVDIDEEAAQEARLHCEEVIVADLDSRPLGELLGGKQYDVAVFGDVLEHLRDPWRVLRDTRPFLSPDGFVVISIPNVAHGNVRLSLLRGAFDYAPLGLLDDTHLRFFTLRSVRELCLRAGYHIDAIERVKIPLFFETDVFPQVDERDFGLDVIDDVRRDPEHDTLQFVVCATPVRDYEHLDLTLDALAKVEMKFADASGKISRLDRQLSELSARLVETESARNELSTRLAESEAARDGLAKRLAETEAQAQARELAAAESVAELRQATALRVRELTEIADEKSGEVARLAQQHAATVASARVAEEKAAEALEELRRENASLSTAQRETESARDELAMRLVEVEELARAREAAAVESLLDRQLSELSARLVETESARNELSTRLAESEAARDGLAKRLAETEAQAQARELAAAESVAELRQATALRVRELTEIADEKSGEVARLAQQHAATVASARVAEEKAAEALEELRRENASLSTAQRETESARDELAMRLVEVEELARAREAAAVESLAELRRSIALSPH